MSSRALSCAMASAGRWLVTAADSLPEACGAAVTLWSPASARISLRPSSFTLVLASKRSAKLSLDAALSV